MFLLSSEDFSQAYKRLQYLRQYSEYRTSQGNKIVEKAMTLKETNDILTNQRNKINEIASDNKQIKKVFNRKSC